jgi:hypothetical protein
MSFWKKLFGGSSHTATTTTARDGKAASPRELTKWYREALIYLDRCGTLDEAKLREVNRISGGMFSESELRNFVEQSQMMLPISGKPGGMDALKQTLRTTMKEAISTFGSLGF